MREATARGPSIDISEFERRMRSSEPSETKRSVDPLAELARLLHGDEAAPAAADPYGQVFAAEQRRGEAPQPPLGSAPHYGEFEAGDLRGSLPPSPAAEDSSYYYPVEQQPEAGWQQHESQDYLDYGVEPEARAPYEEDEGSKGIFGAIKSKLRPWHAVAGVAALGAVSVGWVFVHRGGVVTPREVATINAPEGPAKVQPSAVAEAAPPQRGAAILDRNQNAPVKKVVSNQEQPIDPAAAVRVVRLGDGPVDAPHQPASALSGSSYGAEPKKVKTVSVRPDGTVIDNDAPPPAVARTAPTPPSRASAFGANPRAPDAGDGSPTATPKSPAKPATTPRAAMPARPKPEKPAAEKAAPEQTASVDAAAEDTAPTAATGAFAVQFGAAGSEAEARQLIQHVAAKFGSQLGGRRLGFKLAKVGEKSVYRVRAAGMSRESAVGICEKVKGVGGNCFVAGN